MMKKLNDNALFLSCWYERSRPVNIICLGALYAGLIILSYFTSMNVPARDMNALQVFLIVCEVAQAGVLLLAGTLFVFSLSSRERQCGTLDFHRNSPEAVKDKIVGLVFGAAWFEWLIFGGLFLLEVVLAPLTEIGVWRVMLYNLSLVLTALLFHSAAVLISLLTTRQNHRNSPLVMVGLFFFVMPLFGMVTSFTAGTGFYHILGLGAASYALPPGQHWGSQGWFFGLNLPLIILQAVLQVPLIVFIVRALFRTFCQPNSPAWSKDDILRICFFLLTVVTGLCVGAYFDPQAASGILNSHYRSDNGRAGILFGLASLHSTVYVFLGIAAAFFLSPSYFQYRKYQDLSTKKLVARSAFNDGASAFGPQMVYIMQGAAYYGFYLAATGTGWLNSLCLVFICAGYILGFTAFLEYYRLGEFRNNTAWFVTILAVWWGFLPWLGFIISKGDQYVNFLTMLGPLTGLALMQYFVAHQAVPYLPALCAPLVTAGILWALVFAREENRNPA
ncbi:MAG: hypothetical protein HQL20_07875 [Candidatus Omnitrophica bacterium]|nr:hypothetical protein [Candidatus Omnitrophota bacterium]